MQIKVKRNTGALPTNQTPDGMNWSNPIRACHPPRNRVKASPLTANIPKYSAMKNVAYLNPEYSVMCPATISDSPSGTSNGVRFDSTRPETKNKMNAAAPHGVVTNQCGMTPSA